MGRKKAASVAVQAVAKLAPASRKARKLGAVMPEKKAQLSIPAGARASIPPGKLALPSPATKSFWDPSFCILIGQSGNIHKVVPPSYETDDDDNDDSDADESEATDQDETDDVGGYIFSKDQEETLVAEKGLALSTVHEGVLVKHAHLSDRGILGVRTASEVEPLMPKSGDDKHWPRLQIAIYPNEGRGWLTVLDGEGQQYWIDTTVTFAMGFVKSCNLSEMKYYGNPSQGFFYEGPIDENVRDALILRLKNCHVLLEQDVIGIGTEGKVYKSKGMLSGHDAAFKRIMMKTCAEHKESHITKQLKHPAIRSMIASWRQDENTVYITFELCDRNLKEYGATHREFIPLERSQKFLDVALAVKAAHDKGVCHRDINVSNILITRKGQAKLADFGHGEILEGEVLSAVLKKGTILEEELFAALDGKGISSLFSAPELKKGKRHNFQVDVYSLAFVYFHLMCSRQDLTDALKRFAKLVNSVQWAKDKEKAWRDSALSDEWHGDESLLFRMLNSDAKDRLPLDQVISEIREAIKLLLRKRDL